MANHECHAIACGRACPPRMFMCPAHWRRLPRQHQRAIWGAYRPGQERDLRPSGAYMIVQAEAVLAMALLDSVEPELITRQRDWLETMKAKYGATV